MLSIVGSGCRGTAILMDFAACKCTGAITAVLVAPAAGKEVPKSSTATLLVR